MARPSRFNSSTSLREIVATVSLEPGRLGETRFYDADKSSRYAAMRQYVQAVCGLATFASWDEVRVAYDSEASREFYLAHKDMALGHVAATRAEEAMADLEPVPGPTPTPTGPTPATVDLDPVWQALARLEAHKVDQGAARSIAKALVAEAIAALPPPVQRVELIQLGEPEPRDMGLQHHSFGTLLTYCNTRLADGHRLNVWLAGPAGSGKTTAARNVATALRLPFHFNGAVDTEYKLLGFTDAQGRIVSRPFREAYANGGIYLFDEVDASMPAALLAFNSATSNGFCDFPDGAIERHKDCVIIAAANTYGQGSGDYVGRMKQDNAFLDRFAFLPWDYDEGLERALCANTAWCEHVQAKRANAKRQGLRVVISPRASYFGAALLSAGLSWDEVELATLRKGMTDDQWSALQ